MPPRITKASPSKRVTCLSCVITARADLHRPLKSHMPVEILFDESSRTGQAILIDECELRAAGTCYCEIRIDGDTNMRRGARFIMLDKARNKPVGAGLVLARGLPRLTNTSKGEVASLLKNIEDGNIPAAIGSIARIHHPHGVSASFVSRALSMEADFLIEATRATEGILIIPLSKDCLLMDEKDIEHWEKRIIRIIKEYHIEHPLEPGPDQPAIIGRLKSAPANAVVESVLKQLIDDCQVELHDGAYHMADFTQVIDDPLEGLKGRAFGFYLDAGFSSPRLRDAAIALKQPEMRLKGILRHLCENGYMVKLDRDTYIAKEKLLEAAGKALKLMHKQGDIELSEFRDALGCGRSMALCILEYFDRKGWTERRGRVRVKGSKEPPF